MENIMTEQQTEERKKREELAVAWKRTDKNGDEYISVKVKQEEEKELNFKAFKNKRKKDGDDKPDFIAYKDANLPKE